MQYKAIWKDTFRELSNSIMRFLAILIIIFLGGLAFMSESAQQVRICCGQPMNITQSTI